MAFTLTVATSSDCFTELEAEWLELLKRSVTHTIFQTPQFLKAWWESLGAGQLHVVIIRNDAGIIQAIAPCYIHPNDAGMSELSFIGCVNVSDYLDIIVDRTTQQEVYKLLQNHFQSQQLFTQLYWCSLPETSPTRNFLKSSFSEVVETIQDVAPAIPLPGTWEAYLQSLERKQRHELKRKWRKLEELPHGFEVISEPQAAQAAVSEFISLHQTSSAAKREFWNAAHLAFFAKLIPLVAAQGWLKLYFLQIEGQRVATMLIFDFNNRYELYNSGFNPELYKHVGTGATLTAYTIQQAILAGREVYDFLRGGEEYKYRLGGVKHEVFDIAVKQIQS